MNSIGQIFNNKILGAAVVSWFLAQLIKLIITLFQEKRFDYHKFFASGGMPSSHTSFVVALAISTGQLYGYDSVYFAISAVVSCVVMYDAANVRLQAGKQAAVINQIIEVMENPDLAPEQRLKELLGHTPIQVLAGSILGFAVALMYFPS